VVLRNDLFIIPYIHTIMHEKVREIFIELLKSKLSDEIVQKIPREELSDEDLVTLWRVALIGAIDAVLGMLLIMVLKETGQAEVGFGMGGIEDIISKIGKEEKEDEERFFMILLFAEAGLKLHKGRLLERDRVRVRDVKIGRPDILHVSLLNAFQTPAMRSGIIEVVIHNYDGRIIRIDPSRRPPKRYERFRGLMEQLLREGRVPPRGKPLLRFSEESIEDIVKGKYVIGLTSRGKLEDPIDLVKRIPDDSVLVIGMFPRGYFSESVSSMFNERVAISRYPLHARTVVARIVYAAEKKHGILRNARRGLKG